MTSGSEKKKKEEEKREEEEEKVSYSASTATSTSHFTVRMTQAKITSTGRKKGQAVEGRGGEYKVQHKYER